jgi:hypothetical protein
MRKSMLRIGILATAVVLLFAIAIGCGGNMTTTPGSGGPGSKVAAFFSYHPLGHNGGLHPTAAGVKVSYKLNFDHWMPTVQAAANFSAAGSYNGVCSQLPSVPITLFLNGAGGTSGSNDCAQSFANTTAPGICDTVIGDGTLQNLIVTGTGGSFSNSGHVTVVVFQVQKDAGGNIVGFTQTTTPLQVTLGTSVRKDDAASSFTVHDADTVCMTVDALVGDNLNNLKAMVFKVVP